jgi:hypothetical protein
MEVEVGVVLVDRKQDGLIVDMTWMSWKGNLKEAVPVAAAAEVAVAMRAPVLETVVGAAKAKSTTTTTAVSVITAKQRPAAPAPVGLATRIHLASVGSVDSVNSASTGASAVTVTQ